MEKSIKEVPCSVLMDIFCKLPINTLIQCKCLCKAWRDLLKDPTFVKLHLSRSTSSVIAKVSSKIDEIPVLCFFEHQEKYWSSNDDDGLIVTKLANLGFELVASCNGLICYRERRGREFLIHVTNPIIGEHITLPKGEKYPSVLGIGFNPKTSLYMVINMNGYKRKWEAEICTLGVGAVTWRNIVHVPQYFDYRIGNDGTFINGALHWIIGHTEDFEEFICSFNFDSEKFQSNLKLPPPSLHNKKRVWWLSLGVLKDCLFVSCCELDHVDAPDFDFWVMKEYGVNESWTKEFVIKNSMNNLYLEYNSYSARGLKIIKYTEDGDDIIFLCGMRLYSYNFKKESSTRPDICGIRFAFNDMAFVPSFVSLKDVAAVAVGETICCSN